MSHSNFASKQHKQNIKVKKQKVTSSSSFRYCSLHFLVYTNQETEGSKSQEFEKQSDFWKQN
jgi:hypothetical protein